MKIKQVMAKTGLTDRAIRLYIENDLVKPECDENYNGRKSIEFSETDVENLKNIALLRKADFSIQEIKDLQMGGETAQNTIKEYINRTNEKIQFSSEIIEKIGTLADEENITIEIICEKLSSNLENEKVPVEDMELSPKEQKEKTRFTVISVIGMVLSGIPILLNIVAVFLSQFKFPAFAQYSAWGEEPINETILSLLFITFIKYFFVIQFALCFIIFVLYKKNKKIGKKKDRKKVISTILVIIMVLSLLISPFMFIMQWFCLESRTENPDNYLKIDYNGSIYNTEELGIFPRAIPMDAYNEFSLFGQKYSNTTKYYYRYTDDLFGFTQDIYAEWRLFEHNYEEEKERVLSLDDVVREEKIGDWNVVYFCEEIDKQPNSDFCEHYKFLFFAYNNKTLTVRYVFAEGDEQSIETPYFTNVEW